MGISDIPACYVSLPEGRSAPALLLRRPRRVFFPSSSRASSLQPETEVFFWRTKTHIQKRTEISTWLVCRHLFSCLVLSLCLQDARCEGDTKHVSRGENVGSRHPVGAEFFFSPRLFLAVDAAGGGPYQIYLDHLLLWLMWLNHVFFLGLLAICSGKKVPSFVVVFMIWDDFFTINMNVMKVIYKGNCICPT